MESLSSTPQKNRVLIIDDEADIREIFADILEANGWEAYVAASAKEALELFDKMRFDLITLDKCMPGMDGSSFHYLLAKRHGHGDCFQRNLPPRLPPILIITGVNDPAAVDELMFNEQVVGVLNKPVDANQLIQTTNDLMDWEKQRRSIRRRKLVSISSRWRTVEAVT